MALGTNAAEGAVFHSLVQSLLYEPIFKKLEQDNLAHCHSLREALQKAEQQFPGFEFEFVMSLMNKAGVKEQIDVSESFLRLVAADPRPQRHFPLPSAVGLSQDVQAAADLESKALRLKDILGRIPHEISDRRRFLETIKDIANAIKELLDSVTRVSNLLGNAQHRANLESQKREFVKHSKRFSNTLKTFFRDNQRGEVFMSANLLVNQTNIILRTVRESVHA